MNAKNKALQDMIDRRPWKYIKDHNSGGSVYRALEEFEPHMNRIYTEICERINSNEEELKKENEKLQEVKAENNKLDAENKDLLGKIDQINSEIIDHEKKRDEIQEALLNKTSLLEDIDKRLDELGQRHITVEVLTQILESDISSHDEFLNRVKTDNEHRELIRQNHLLEQSILEKQEREHEAASKLEQLESDILSEENRLDEAKQLYQMWLNSIQVVNKAQQRGYSSEILGQLIEALFKLSVKDEPIKSARRLLRRLEKANEEIELDEAISKKTAALESLEQQYAKVEGTLRAVTDDALGKINTVEKMTKKGISSVEETGRKSIIATRDHSLQSVKMVEQASIRAVGKVKESSLTAMGKLSNDVARVFLDNSFALQLAIDTTKKEVQNWGDLKERAGRLTELIKLATIFLGVHRDIEALLNIDPAIILRLQERIHLYIVIKWPGSKTKASKELSQADLGISSMFQADLRSVSRWLLDALQEMERKVL